jgi:Asp-tRNA(Asn)/Glu-tRNA(Gln) amidotransferase B subunit
MPEVPSAVRRRYADLNLPSADILILADEMPILRYFDAVVAAGASPKLAANWVLGDLMAFTKVPVLWPLRLLQGDTGAKLAFEVWHARDP